MINYHYLAGALGVGLLAMPIAAHADSITLFDQDFEAPVGFVNGYGSGYDDLSQQPVNDLYGNQPAGFSFTQQATVETLQLDGDQAFGTGYDDPTGQGASYALGMQQRIEDDRLSLTFAVGDFDFFNLQFDMSNIGISGGIGSPFAEETVEPTVNLSVFDGGWDFGQNFANTPYAAYFPAPLAADTHTGTASALSVLDWTTYTGAFDVSGNTTGTVTLQFDLANTGYIALDNFLITASDDALEGIPVKSPVGGMSPVPLPAGLPLLLAGLLGLGVAGRARRKA